MSSQPGQAAQEEQAPPPQQQQQQPNLTQIYQALSSYPFAQDSEYQSGLATILGHPERAVTVEELEQEEGLVLQAQCFYFARKYNVQPVDPAAYQAWLRERGAPPEQEVQQRTVGHGEGTVEVEQPTQPQPQPQPQSAAPTQAPPPTDDQQPPYPTSFAAIVDLITRNIPVPGIEEIPTTVLEPGSSKVDKTPRRRKPWEKEADPDEGEASTTEVEKSEGNAEPGAGSGGESAAADALAGPVDINGHRETGTGVVNILKPNAVPDSGLLSKD